MHIRIFYIILFLFITNLGSSQKILTKEDLKDTARLNNAQIVKAEIVNGDTVLRMAMAPVIIIQPRVFKNEREKVKYTRLVYNVKKVYPYAILIRQTYADVEKQLALIPNKAEQKKYIKTREDELKTQFEDQLKSLTITQGRILIKLVDRETGNTTYDVIKDFKGSLNAFFWQSLALMFGSNLKSEYKPEEEDKLIEEIIIQIENGQI